MIGRGTQESCLVSVGSWGGLMFCCLGGHTRWWKNLWHHFKGVNAHRPGSASQRPRLQWWGIVAMPWVLEAQALGDFVGPAGPGLISLFCLGLPLFPGKRLRLHLVIIVIGKWKGRTILLPFLLILYLSRTMCYPGMSSDHRWLQRAIFTRWCQEWFSIMGLCWALGHVNSFFFFFWKNRYSPPVLGAELRALYMLRKS